MADDMLEFWAEIARYLWSQCPMLYHGWSTNPPPRNKGLRAGLIKGNQWASTVPVPRRMMHTYTGTFLLMFIAIFSCGAAYITCPNSNGKSEKGTCGIVKMIQKIQQYIEFSSTFWCICLEVWNMCVWKNTRYLRTYIYIYIGYRSYCNLCLSTCTVCTL